MVGDEDAIAAVLNRLRRAQGQLAGVIAMIEQGRECKDVVTQLTAAQAALHRAGLRLMSAGMRYCIVQPETAAEQGMSTEQMEELFMKLR